MNAFTFLRTALAVLLLAGTAACEKELPQAHDPESHFVNTYAELFDQFWDTMNNRYLFWDQDTTNWDAMHARYRPLFARLDITKPADQRKSIEYFNQMLGGIQDGHLFISFHAPAIADSFVQPRLWQLLHHKIPSFDRAEAHRTPAYYTYTYYDLDAAHYLDPGSIAGVYHSPDSIQVQVLEGTIHGNVLYLGFDGEQLATALNDAGSNPLKAAYTAFRQAYHTRPGLKGIIVDMRGSGGGYILDASVLASDFIDRPLFRGSTRSKSGPGRSTTRPGRQTTSSRRRAASASPCPW